MESKKTIFVGGIGEDVDQDAIYEAFSTFGDIIQVDLPPAATNFHQQQTETKHRGFAFVTYASAADAQDAIDNMDLNELRGRVLKVNLSRPMKEPLQLGGNRAIWESEEWLQEHVKPLAQSGGVQARKAGNVAQEEEPPDQGNEDAMEE